MNERAPFEFFESEDLALTASWIHLRRRSFRIHYPWLPEEFGYEDETDRKSIRVFSSLNGVVVGGARLTISSPEFPRLLPLEEYGPRLRTLAELSPLGLDRNPCAEISRMAVDPECTRGLEASYGLARELCRAAAHRGVDAIFSICPEGPARLNRLNARKCGVAFRRFHEVPTAFGVPMWLCAFSGILRAFGNVDREAA